ncbi:MAG: hypothetical protein HF312_15740 [Ignavibacteria bacterium]|jgi:hypothetical protein|nr:hypothetical protein [Ignavibacteria bacterium]
MGPLALFNRDNPVRVGGAALKEITVNFAQGASVSDIVDIKGYTLVGVVLPATLAGDACKIRRSSDGATAGISVQDSYGAEQSILLNGAAAYRAVPDVVVLTGVNYVQLYTTSAGAAQIQATAQTVRLVVKAL